MSKRPTPGNPYGKAAHNYSSTAAQQDDVRATEAKALLKAARMLQELQAGWDAEENKVSQAKIEETLKFNRQIWVLFYDHAVSGEGPNTLNTNVVNLAGFVFKRSMEILAAPAPEKLNILININREVANGLMTKKQ